ncbi:MAG: hypothetical protein ABL912_12670 [Novosphingobium sp.]
MESQRYALGIFVALGGMWLFVGMALSWVPRRLGFSFVQSLISVNLAALVGVALLWQAMAHAFGSNAAVVYFSIWLVFTTSAGIASAWLTANLGE